MNILVRWNHTSGNLEIRCPEVEIIYASLISHWFIQAINLTHGSVMLSINACDVDLITIMCNTINDCIGKRTCFASKSSTSNNYGKESKIGFVDPDLCSRDKYYLLTIWSCWINQTVWVALRQASFSIGDWTYADSWFTIVRKSSIGWEFIILP